MGTSDPPRPPATRETDRERLLSSVLDTVPTVLLVFDRQGQLTFVNRAGQDACREVLKGAHPQAVELLHSDGGTQAPLVAARMRTGEQPSPFETSWSLNGETRFVEWTYQRTLDADGGLAFVVCAGLDVTEKRRSQQALHGQIHFLQNLVDTIPSPLFFKTADGLYRGCNKAFEEMLGIPREQIVGKTVYDISPPELADVYFKKDRELFDHPGVQVYESSVRYANGETRDVVYYKATYFDLAGQVEGLVGIFLDITDRKRAERELGRARDELELRVQERTAQLEQAKDRAEAADRAKGEFLNIASHELRTPLTTLRLTVHQVTNDVAGGLPIGERHLTRMDRQLSRLTRMVADLLDVSRLERGTLTLRPTVLDLTLLLAEAVEELRPAAEPQRLELGLPSAPLPLLVDADRIRQVISNLVDNALKYTPPHTPVRVSLSTTEAGARVEVRDFGKPLTPEQRQRLFLPFVRLGSPHHQEGLGLGLYISREIASRHGGTLEVHSDEDGNTFSFELPNAPPASGVK
jgi:PAS domain S-box-containing protein